MQQCRAVVKVKVLSHLRVAEPERLQLARDEVFNQNVGFSGQLPRYLIQCTVH